MNRVDYDVLVVGQGLAGTVLSYTLWQRGLRTLVVDQPQPNSSSRTAGGLFNPITGRQMRKTWLCDTLFPFLHDFYPQLEQAVGVRFFHPLPLYFPFSSQQKQTDWVAQSADAEYRDYVRAFHPKGLYEGFLLQPFGGMEVQRSGYVHIGYMLDAYRDWLEDRECYLQETLQYADVQPEEGGVRWKQYRFRYAVFCQGIGGQDNPFFPALDFRPVKGELLLVRFEQDPQLQHIVNRNGFILPVDEDGICRVGATYDNHDLQPTPTEKGLKELSERLDELVQVPFEVLDQWAGIRPATHDRRPYIGLHAEHPQIGIFNGLGAKGVSLSPYLAHHFCEHLLQGTPLMAEVDYRRGQKRKA